jgi:Rrf2 family protein
MASVNTQFAIAVHVLSNLAVRSGADDCVTSEKLAASVNTNASFVRRLLSKLAKAGLVTTTRGKGGSCALARKAKDIDLLEIYRAVEAPKVFAIHQYPKMKTCMISCRINQAMGEVLDQTQSLVEKNLKGICLSDIVASMKRKS